ncbi:synaptojanin-1 [Aplysia californica]|uniref:phosphoinositide 5-phosphatase n=1 Tax=Aplysia californica TaxID=6500 RepID=A0ABM0ZZC4_APLCA|nr:synaptojanin-1 [Aplysia californica]
MAMGKGFRVFHKLPPDQETPYSVLMDSKAVENSLMFESGAVVVLTVDEVEPLRKQYTKVVDAYGCLGALCFNMGNQRLQYLVMVTSCLSVGKIGDSEVFRISAVQFVSLRNDPADEDRVAEIRKLLSSGTFYFTWAAGGDPWDLSLCAQRNLQDHDTDNKFFWNRMLHVHFQRYGVDCSKWLLKVMCGGVEIRTIYAGHRQAKACIISRLSCERAGTRFNVRGVNDDGSVANFVETEQVIFLENQIASFVQTRGSVPLFWEQPGIQVGSHKVHMSRGYEMAAPAFDRHLRTVRQQYGEQVIVNLLGSKEGEKMLSQAFYNHHAASSHKQDVPYYHFDYHAEVKGTNLKNLEKLKTRILKHMHQFDFFYTEGDTVSHQQTGTIRTNCLDCLDRTNATQMMIGLEMLNKQLQALGLAAKPQMVGRFEEVYKQIWVHNGDHMSRIYTGTGALGGGRSKYSDASRSASRTIQNNFLDGSKQEAIDVLLMGSSLYGALADRARALLSSRYLHASESILWPMTRRYAEYTHPQKYRICVGTYNVNGGKHYRSIAYKHQSLADWLLDAHKTHPNVLVDDVDYDKPVDIFAVGFEEIVDLNASNIMSASTTNAREWQKEVIKTISRDHKYVVLTSIQLVGVVLYVCVRPNLAPFIRDVAVDKVKTGLGGATGNKGGVGIRFLLNSTSICFVCAHLAAGQNQVTDRNNDYNEITRKMAFPMSPDSPRKGRSVLSHDCVFWCGDFNYRIDLAGDEVKSLVSSENWGALQEMDQLNAQRAQGNAFKGFNEGKTDFAPTYKYDTFSDDYDTSEKCRTPAWTDRVLWRVKRLSEDDDPEEREKQVKLLLYARAELRTSDHRPVMALFDVETPVLEEDKKSAVLNQVVSEQGPPDGTVIVSMADGGELSDETVNEIVAKFNEVGDIIIVRFVGSDMWVLYQRGQCALEALQFDQQEFAGSQVQVRLKTQDWREEIEKELNLCSSNTAPMFNQFSNSLLGDDFSIPSMEFDIDEGEAEELADAEVASALDAPLDPRPSSGRNTPTSQHSPAPGSDQLTTSDIPGGPPVPGRPLKSSPTHRSGSRSPAAASWDSGQSVVKEAMQPLRASPAPTGESKQPPARPSAPPSRPPPPQRPPGGPPRPASAAVAAPAAPMTGPGGPDRPAAAAPTKMRQPLRPAPSEKAKIKKPASKPIGQIGLPTNVTHHGHASSIEEAQALIEKLMAVPNDEGASGSSDDSGAAVSLPPPLAPSRSETNLSSASDSSQLVPKPVPRSKTSNELLEDSTPDSVQQRPIPKQRSQDSPTDDSKLVKMTAAPEVKDPGLSAPIARPRPAPRRDVQSCIVDSPVQGLSQSLPPAPNKRPGSVLVMPTLPGPASRPAPPPPSARPAPPPPSARPVSASPSPTPLPAPVPPARPSRPSAPSSNKTNNPSAPDPFDSSFVNDGKNENAAHILDRENSMVDTNPLEADPFDTSFVKPQGLAFPGSVFGPNFSNPAVKQTVDLSADQLNSKSSSDPFDTSFATKKGQDNSQSAFSDPFDTSRIPRQSPVQFALDGSGGSAANIAKTDVSNENNSNSQEPFVSTGGEAFAALPSDLHTPQAPSISPPPLPPDASPPSIKPPSPPPPMSCPSEAPPPPPPPRPVDVADPAPLAPPPVPSRTNAVPPPIPKRPT